MAGGSPCASCKLLRRRCAKDCSFAPYFPSDDPHKFAIVHKVFGASNINKMLQEIRYDQRADAVSSLVFEANARMRDPVYGCVGAISYLQNQVSQLQMQLAVAQAEILCIQMHQNTAGHPVLGGGGGGGGGQMMMSMDFPISEIDQYQTASSSSSSEVLLGSSNSTLTSSESYHHQQQQQQQLSHYNYIAGGFTNSSSSNNISNNNNNNNGIQGSMKRESLWI
ncbi:LOB domain-containing protein 12-like [Impatiens glandulifera]|uniref:LOB domain-containing protein 12-like n=1 Tax=Impatiens glandulifera TaxID=253017 RepID=UPI001FB176B3|nr:LOB domain-containing protein 12-like [Impatiens glandulifera]